MSNGVFNYADEVSEETAPPQDYDKLEAELPQVEETDKEVFKVQKPEEESDSSSWGK